MVDRPLEATLRVVVLAGLVGFALALAGGASVGTGLADEAGEGADGNGSDEVSPLPAEFYGSVAVDGDPVPEGTTVTATIDGEERGSTTVDEDGDYGGESMLDEPFEVDGDREDENATITFLVDGSEADRTATWRGATTTELDLTLESADADDEGGSAGSGGGGGGGGDEGGNGGGADDGSQADSADANDDGDTAAGPGDDARAGTDRDDVRDDRATDDGAGTGDSDGDDTIPGFGVIGGIAALTATAWTVVIRALRSARG